MTKAQDRARERRRYEKVQARELARRAQRQRNRRVMGVVAAVVVVVLGVVWASTKLNDKDPLADGTPTNAVTTPSDSTTTTSGATPTTAVLEANQKLAAGCTMPPATQTQPKTFATAPDKALAAGKTYLATLTTNCGKVTLELDGARAPQTVASFVTLAKDAYWAPSPCHRLVTSGIFVLQCGDPTGTGSGNPGYGFGIENAPTNQKYPRGTLAMARVGDQAQSNGGQFFIVYKDTDLQNDTAGGYTIFGKVIGGMDIVDKIAAAGDTSEVPNAPISILSVAITEKKA